MFKDSLILFIVLFSLSYLSLAQNSKLDSLKQELSIHTKEDTARIDLLLDFAFESLNYDISKGQKACIEAEKIAKKINCENCLADVLYVKAWIEVESANYDGARDYVTTALSIYQKNDHLEGQSLCHNCLGATYYYQGKLEDAIEYYTLSAEIDKATGNIKALSGSYLNIGNGYAELGDFDKSLAYYFKALELKTELKDDYGITNCLGNIGSIYGEQGNYPEALYYLKKEQRIHDRLGYSSGYAACLLNMGSIYAFQGKQDEALKAFDEVIEINKDLNNKRIEASAYNAIGSVYREKKEFNKAIQYLQKALSSNRESENLHNIGINLNNIGELYILKKDYDEALKFYQEAKIINDTSDLMMGLCSSYIGIAKVYFAKNNYSLAQEAGESAMKIANDLNLLVEQSDASEVLSKVYAKLGKFDKAFEFHQKFKIYSDSLFNEENIEKITQIEYEYKYKNQLEAAKFKEMALTETVNETTDNLEKSQRNLLYGIIIFLVVTVLLGGIIFFLRLRNVKEKTQNIITEQKLLRSQMTPHFIFNAMSVLQGIILNKEDTKAVSYLSKFSRLLRITLENSRDQLVSLKNELVAVENYIDLQNIEAKTPFVYSINIAENIDSEKVKIPPMLIQPFIENSIEHGFVNHEGIKKIEITISRTDNQLNCIIQDNGVGVNTQKVSANRNKKSLSTAITTERIELLSKNSKSKGSISIEDRRNLGAQGTQVTMVIPYQVG